jgi:molybdenum cofactor biosynthesis protein B
VLSDKHLKQHTEADDGRAYGELFRMLSYTEIGAAAMLSRATAGLIGNLVVITMPGSPAAVRLAMEKLIVPELGHLVREARR